MTNEEYEKRPLINIREMNQKQSVKLVHNLLQTRKGCEYDGIQAARFFRENWGIDGDHHLFTDVMDSMTRNGEAVCTQPYGFTKYMIN